MYGSVAQEEEHRGEPRYADSRSARTTDYGQVAQMVEHRREVPGVVGSIPTLTTITEDTLE